MKPHRLALTHSLVLNYGLYKKMEVYTVQSQLQWAELNYISVCVTGLQTVPGYVPRHV